jgi:transposase-like protein
MHQAFRTCTKPFNERSGTLLNRTQDPSDVIALGVLWRLRDKLSLRDLPEMFAVRGIVFSHEAAREWEAKLTPALAEDLRRRRRGQVGRSWYVDETYLKVHGRWCYLYRAIDRNGNLVDVLFSEHRDMAAAQAFFRSAQAVTGITPDRVTTDGHDSYPRAIRSELGQDVRHRTRAYLTNSHRNPAYSPWPKQCIWLPCHVALPRDGYFGLRGRSALIGLPEPVDVDLDHLQHRLGDPSSPRRILVLDELAEHRRNDLPEHAVAVLQPPALLGGPALGQSVPEPTSDRDAHRTLPEGLALDDTDSG